MSLLPDLATHDGRRAWAFVGIMGGCVVFTLFAAAAVWLLSSDAAFTFYLGLAAHVQILVGMTALGWAMGRRVQIEAGKDGAKISDGDGDA